MCCYYNIEIKIKPELFNGSPHYFWCITKNTSECSSNSGHGWAISIEDAATEAIKYYNLNGFNC